MLHLVADHAHLPGEKRGEGLTFAVLEADEKLSDVARVVARVVALQYSRTLDSLVSFRVQLAAPRRPRKRVRVVLHVLFDGPEEDAAVRGALRAEQALLGRTSGTVPTSTLLTMARRD